MLALTFRAALTLGGMAFCTPGLAESVTSNSRGDGAKSPTAPLELQAVEIDDHRIEYYDLGQGQPIVLIHGAHCGADDWFSIVEPLAKQHRLIIPEGLVYGLDAWRLWLLLDHLRINRVALIGHSGGAFLNRKMYRLKPQRVWAFVCVDSAAAGGKVRAITLPNSRWSPPVAAMFEKNKEQLAAISPNRTADYPSDANVKILKRTYQRKQQTQQQRAEGRSKPVAIEVRGPYPPRPELIEDSDTFFNCPILVFNSGRGKLDASDPPHATETWTGGPIQAENYEFILVRDSGHWIWLDQPALFLKNTLLFLTLHRP